MATILHVPKPILPNKYYLIIWTNYAQKIYFLNYR